MFFFLLKKYEQLKDVMPDMGWLDDILPDEKRWKNIHNKLLSAKGILAEKMEFGKYKYTFEYLSI